MNQLATQRPVGPVCSALYFHLTYLYYLLHAQMSCFPSMRTKDLVLLLSGTLRGSTLRGFS